MQLSLWMDQVPIWGIFILLVVLVSLSMELGFAIGRRDRRLHPDAQRIKVGTVVGAVLGLLAFILAFTFSNTSSRLDLRKELLLKEVNAIGTLYLRAEALSGPAAEQSRSILRAYTEDRFRATSSGNRDMLFAHLSLAGEFHQELWAIAMPDANADPNPLKALYISALNDVIDVHQERVTIGMQRRMPTVFWLALFTLVVITMVLGGYDTGVSENPRRGIVSLSISLAFGTVLVLVVALDRPFVRGIEVDHTPFIDLQKSMGVRVGGGG